MVHLVSWVSRVVITVEKRIFENIDIDIRRARRHYGSNTVGKTPIRLRQRQFELSRGEDVWADVHALSDHRKN